MLVYSLTSRTCRRGLTLLEVTLVISVMMSLITLLFIGARSWRVGSDRSMCILNQRSMQLAVRSYQNMYGFSYGAQPSAGGGGLNIIEQLYDKEFISANLYQCATGDRLCPATGDYSVPEPNSFPQQGTLFMTCSLAESRKHEPDSISTW